MGVGRRLEGGSGLPLNDWLRLMGEQLEMAQTLSDAKELMKSAENSFATAREEMDALVVARDRAKELSDKALAAINKRIGELGQHAHRHPGS